MSLNTYISLSIFKQDRSQFSSKEFDSLKYFMFNSPRLNSLKEKFISYYTPIIFELTDDDYRIEGQFSHYSGTYILDNLELLYEITFPFYDFWLIESWDFEDNIRSFKFIRPGESEYPNVDPLNRRTCKYNFDKIIVNCNSELPSQLQYINWERKTDFTFESLDYQGQYSSDSSKLLQKENKYKFTPDDGLIPLDQKYDVETGGIHPIWFGKKWYSEEKLLNFLENDFINSNLIDITFYYKGRKTRYMDKSTLGNVWCFDGWDNCGDLDYLNYLEQRPNSTK